MKQIDADSLDWLIALAGEAITAGLALSKDAANARLAQVILDADQGAMETDSVGEPQMYLLSRETGDQFVPLYVFRRQMLAEKAQRLLQRGSGMQFEVLPLPLED